MLIVLTTQEIIWLSRAEYHVLTYAEEGFSPLSIHAEAAGVTKDSVCNFANAVNHSNEVGSLYPIANISAVPRSVIRDKKDADALRYYMEAFFYVNVQTIQARKLLCDFRTPYVEKFVHVAIEMATASQYATSVEYLAIIE